MDKFKKLFDDSFNIHVGTKTIDKVFHDFTAEVYEFIFKVRHLVNEKKQDIDVDKPVPSLEEAKNEIYDIIEKTKIELEQLRAEELSIGMNKLTEDLIDDAETLCGTAKWFLPREEEGMEVEEGTEIEVETETE